MKTCLCKIATIVCLGALLVGFAQTATLLNTITNPDPTKVVSFGRSVAGLGSDRVIIGATTKAGSEHDVGVAYLFNTNGTLLTTFTNPAPQGYDEFGSSIAVLGSDRVFIGARGYGADSGVVYLFNTNGTLLNTITNPTPSSDEEFGGCMAAVGSDYLLVGGPYEYDPSISFYSGIAYLFSTNGILQTTFTNPAPVTNDSYFGCGVAALGSDRVMIAAPSRLYVFSTNGTLLNTVFTPDASSYSLAVVGSDRVLVGVPEYNYHNSNPPYVERAYLLGTNNTLLTTFTNPGPAPYGFFGGRLAALGSDRVLISAVGRTYLFSTNCALLCTLTNPTTANDLYFGGSVAAVGSEHAIIGGANIGAAYLFSFGIFTPRLSVTHSDGSLIVSWPRAADDFVLDQSVTLAGWSQVPTWNYRTNATSIFISVPEPSDNRFYRLSKP